MIRKSIKLFIIQLLIFFSIINHTYAQRTFTTLPFKMVIGHANGIRGSFGAYKMLLNQISTDFPYYILMDRSVGYCYFVNRYINDIDTTALKYISINSKEEADFYKTVRANNQTRDKKNKIRIK